MLYDGNDDDNNDDGDNDEDDYDNKNDNLYLHSVLIKCFKAK